MAAPADPARVYVVGDIHGQREMLVRLHARIEDDLRDNPPGGPHAVVHIGDYVDRGPDSRGVIAHLIEGAAAGRPWINLLGNHDRMMRLFLVGPGERDPRLDPAHFWLDDRLGGAETLRSYGISVPGDLTEETSAVLHLPFRAVVPAAHVAFLDSLIRFWRWGCWYFAHAGVAPGAPLEAQTEDDLIWIRDEFLKSRIDYGATVIHGHTPVDAVEDHGNRIAIDTGAAYGGPLTCLVLEGAAARLLDGPVLRSGA